MSKTTILLADDHPVFLRGLRELIKGTSFNIVAEAQDGVETVEYIRKHKPNIAILDITMPRLSGLDVLARISRWAERPYVVLLSMYESRIYLRKALEFGAEGYLLKQNADDELVDCLTTVAAGRHYVSPVFSGFFVDMIKNQGDDANALLTATERKILLLIADYKTSREIAELLGVSIRTVQNHRARMCNKLKLRGTNSLLQFARKFVGGE